MEKGRTESTILTCAVLVWFCKSPSTIYRTETKPKCAAITPQMLNGQGDHLIRRSLNEGYTESYIICPATIVVTRSRAKFIYIREGPNVFYMVLLEDLVEHLFAPNKATTTPRQAVCEALPHSQHAHVMEAHHGHFLLRREEKWEAGRHQCI
ncbi:hypothetical protein EI94DRAFT_1702452 [Lactarius quietus]|nr:hypothetical protein EI94DRAFT_1702452 [Lactarius quietus]